MNAILLSAGFGTRFKPYTERTAKPTIPFMNLPLIGYSMYYANKWSCRNIIINTHHLPKTIEDCASSLSKYINPNIKIVNEAPNILDSGGGVKNVENDLNMNDHFLVFNTDIPHILPNFDFDQLKKSHIQSNSLVTFITCDLPNIGTKVRGVWTQKNSNKVEDIGIGPKKDLICKHYTGVMLISKKLFDLQPHKKSHNIIYDIILPAIKNGSHVNTFHIDNLNWYETGNLESYLDASFEVMGKFIDEPDSLFTIELNSIFNKFNIKNKILAEDNFKLVYEDSFKPIDPGSKLSGSILLGKGIRTPKNSSVSNSVIYSDADFTQSSYNRALLL